MGEIREENAIKSSHNGWGMVESPMILAAKDGNIKAFSFLLDARADMHVPSSGFVAGGFRSVEPGLGIASVAAFYSNDRFFRTCVEWGADAGRVFRDKVDGKTVYQHLQARSRGEADKGLKKWDRDLRKSDAEGTLEHLRRLGFSKTGKQSVNLLGQNMELGLDKGEFIDRVLDRCEKYSPESEIPFEISKGKGSYDKFEDLSLRSANNNLCKALDGEHGGLNYGSYVRFLGILAHSVVDAGVREARENGRPDTGWDWLESEGRGEDSKDLLMEMMGRYEPAGFKALLKKTGNDPFPKYVKDLGMKIEEYERTVLCDRLAAAAARGDMGDVNAIIGNRCRGNLVIDGSNVKGQDRPLFEAVRYGQVGSFKDLLDAGANEDLTSRKTDGLSLLGQAVFYEQPEITKLILERGADPKVLQIQEIAGKSVADIVADWAERKPDGKSSEILGILRSFEQKKTSGKKLRSQNKGIASGVAR